MFHDAAKLRRIEEARKHHHYPEQRQREALSAWRSNLAREVNATKRTRLLRQLNQLETKLGEALTT